MGAFGLVWYASFDINSSVRLPLRQYVQLRQGPAHWPGGCGQEDNETL